MKKLNLGLGLRQSAAAFPEPACWPGFAAGYESQSGSLLASIRSRLRISKRQQAAALHNFLMKLKFKHQAYQADAVRAMVDCFQGQPSAVFHGDHTRINVEQIFKFVSPGTEVKSL